MNQRKLCSELKRIFEEITPLVSKLVLSKPVISDFPELRALRDRAERGIVELWEKIFPSPEEAREIMGANFLGVEDAVNNFELHPTKEQLTKLKVIPFRRKTLYELKDNYVLVPGFPLSIDDLCRIEKVRRNAAIFTNDSKKADNRWYLIGKGVVPNSNSKSFEDQRKMLSEEEEIPWACELYYAVSLYYLVYRQKFLKRLAVCRDLGEIDKTPLFIKETNIMTGGWSLPDKSVGIVSSRKPEMKTGLFFGKEK